MLVGKTLKEFIIDASTGKPTPGGGSVAALAGSLGAALTQMVGNLTFDKEAYDQLNDDIKAQLQKNFTLLQGKMKTLSGIVDEDSKAFNGVIQAFKMPKSSEDERKIRTKAIQEGYKHALDVPLRCAKECLQVLELQLAFANFGNINAITDVGVGALMAYSGLEGALLNVRINLLNIKDEDYKSSVNIEMNRIFNQGNKVKKDLLEIVYERLSD